MKKIRYLSIFSVILLLTLFFNFNIFNSKNNLNYTNASPYKVYTGKDIKVAIIDSGVDVTHPDLKNNIIGGYDFIENKPIYKDGDERSGHGTHVAGIIAANGEKKGIAPDAKLLIYRVVSNDEEILTNNISSAINKSIEDGAQIINISLKSPSNLLNTSIENSLKKAYDNGILIVKSNGNEGPDNWTTEGLAGSDYVISVGNSKSPSLQPLITNKDNSKKIELKNVNNDLVFSDSNDEYILDLGYCSLEDIKSKDINNKTILINSINDYYIDDVVQEAKIQGAKSIIIANENTETWNVPSLLDSTNLIPAAIISGNNVSKLREIIKDNVKISNKEIEEIYYQSSRGPSKATYNLKPDISALGTHILSTVPSYLSENKSGYRFNTGTSMSSPYVAGTAALIKEAHLEWTPDQIKAALCNNAYVLTDLNSKPYPVLSQGSGRIDLNKSLNTEIFITPNNLSFGLIDNSKQNKSIEKNIQVQSISPNNKIYNVRSEFEGTSDGLKLDIDDKFEIPSNTTKTLPIKLTIDSNCQSGIYSGRIYLKSKNDSKIVPFIVIVNSKGYTLDTASTDSLNDLLPNK